MVEKRQLWLQNFTEINNLALIQHKVSKGLHFVSLQSRKHNYDIKEISFAVLGKVTFKSNALQYCVTL